MTNNWKYILLMATAFPTAAAFAQTGDAGKQAVEQERYEDAKSIYKKQLNQKKADNAYYALGDIYLKTDKPDSAAYYFKQGISKNDKSAINHAGLGKVEMSKGNKAEAEKHFSQALKYSKSKDANVLTAVAEAYVTAENKTEADLNKAVGYLQTAVQRDKNNTAAYMLLGDAQLELKKGGEAMTSYDNAIRIDDKNPNAYLRRGQLYTRSRNYTEAEQAFQKAIEINPNFAPAYRDLGELYYFAGQYDKALSTFKKYVDMAEKTPETRAKYASFLFLTKNYDETLKEVQEVLKTDPNNTVMNRLQAYSYLELGQPDKALQAMESYLQKVDKSKLIAEDYEYYGRILSKNNQHAKATENLSKAVEMAPDKVELYQELASAYAKSGQYDKAIDVYNKKREKLSPSNADFYYMGNIYMQAGEDARAAKNEQKALEFFKKADETYANVTTTNPTYAYGHYWRGLANANLDPESTKGLAKPHFEEFLKLASGEPDKYKAALVDANNYLAYYYFGVKTDRNIAKKYYQEVLKLDPNNEQAKTAMAEINNPAQRKKK
ncbi:tetratricopeptide repeat protein [Pontibacter sp. KCTC 32443]|uniref:tetratricopeptide repeat protein n=1 Tax=Pontibacter TaxID=323449 RepID=UPI00164E9C49|nr:MULTISPECIES: tetratricopeptide repeat protein [Pontibacter]MBC5775944.1 tetratricopeptide repeat protein [Pontibacter sp. KCTC 32443]